MKRPLISLLLAAFITTSCLTPSQAQAATAALPAAGTRLSLSPNFSAPTLLGVTVDPANPLKFNFLIDQGDQGISPATQSKDYEQLIRYFMAGLTTPEKDLWVNLSPYEGKRIVDANFGKTEMGRDLLAQDYVLKQITSSLIYPADELGRKFWAEIYKKAQEQFGTTTIPVNTFNKVWIVPSEAEVYEQGVSAYVVKSHLKVMLEEDYLAMKKIGDGPRLNDVNTIGSQVVREIVLPALEKEVNEGKNFAQLRQINNALILATWYKKTLKESLLGLFYVDKGKTRGIDHNDAAANQKIYEQYLAAFKKGAYNFIKEEQDPYSGKIIPRKYFSGGFSGKSYAMVTRIVKDLPKGFAQTISSKKGRLFNAAMVAQTDSDSVGLPSLTSIKDLVGKDFNTINRILKENKLVLRDIHESGRLTFLLNQEIHDIRDGFVRRFKGSKLAYSFGGSEREEVPNGRFYRIESIDPTAASRLTGKYLYIPAEFYQKTAVDLLRRVKKEAEEGEVTRVPYGALDIFMQHLANFGLSLSPYRLDRINNPPVIDIMTPDGDLISVEEAVKKSPDVLFWRVDIFPGYTEEELKPEAAAAVGMLITAHRNQAMTSTEFDTVIAPVLVENNDPAIRKLALELNDRLKLIIDKVIALKDVSVDDDALNGKIAELKDQVGQFDSFFKSSDKEPGVKNLTNPVRAGIILKDGKFNMDWELPSKLTMALAVNVATLRSDIKWAAKMEENLLRIKQYFKYVASNDRVALITFKNDLPQAIRDLPEFRNAPSTFTMFDPRASLELQVIVVDDDPTLRPVLDRYLQLLGFDKDKIGTASNEDQGFAIVPPGFTGYILIDWNFGKGKELAEKVRQHSPAAKILFMSGSDRPLDLDTQEMFMYKPNMIRDLKNFVTVPNAAMNVSSNPTRQGGIDLTAYDNTLLIKRDKQGLPLPVQMQDKKIWNNIQGLRPVVTSITPVSSIPGLTDK
jgi:CheY-like chemotaxis protein